MSESILSRLLGAPLAKYSAEHSDKWVRLCERRGQCPTCRSKEYEGHQPGMVAPPYGGCKCNQDKEAAQMNRKTVMVPQHSDHCPHCDFEFREKSYPRMKHEGKDLEDRSEVIMNGEYDEHCPQCDGIIDQKESTDEEIADSKGWDYPGRVEQETARRDAQRRRREAREAKANEKQAGDQSVIQRLLQREGGTQKITKDSGGVTKGGIAETSGMPAAQIRSLTPEKINQLWQNKWQESEGVNHPGIREILFDARGNMGEPAANRMFQRSVNSLLPPDQQIPDDGVLGSNSLAAINKVMQDDLGEKLMANYKAHHPAKYGPYANGWANRRAALWDSPALADLHRAQPAAPATPPTTSAPKPVTSTPITPTNVAPVAPVKPGAVPAPPPVAPLPPAQPVKVQGTPQPGFTVEPPAKAASEHFVVRLLSMGGPEGYGPNRAPDVVWTKEAKSSPLETLLRIARNKTHTHPTPGQTEAGNYAKGQLSFRGLQIKIENPEGSTRRKVGKDGKELWRTTMLADYGYFVGTKGHDGDAVDCFIGPDLESDKVFVIDQNNDAGHFDEAKCMIGCSNEEEAKKLYLKHYPKGWATHIRSISECSIEELKYWLRNGDTKKPYQAPRAREKSASRVSGMVADEGALPEPKEQMVSGLWGSRDPSMRPLVSKLSSLLGGHVSETRGNDAGPEGCEPGLLQGKLPMDTRGGSIQKSEEQHPLRVSGSKFASYGVVQTIEHPEGHTPHAFADTKVASGKGADRTGRGDSSIYHALVALQGSAITDGGSSKSARADAKTTGVSPAPRVDIGGGGGDPNGKQANGDSLEHLMKAKAHSDAKRYTAKQAILRKLVGEAPEDFTVDSPDEKHPGLTHKPTGFQIHAPKTVATLVKEKEAGAFRLMGGLMKGIGGAARVAAPAMGRGFSTAARATGSAARAAGPAMGRGLTNTVRFVGNVPKGEKYFSTPGRGAWRAAHSLISPNLGKWGNRAKWPILGTALYQAAAPAYAHLQQTAQKAYDTVEQNPMIPAAVKKSVLPIAERAKNWPVYTALKAFWDRDYSASFPEIPAFARRQAAQEARARAQEAARVGLRDFGQYHNTWLDNANVLRSPMAKPVLKTLSHYFPPQTPPAPHP
jgi:lysozyme family protein